ncbi:YMGG-like glycine zipper-containing protein [Aquibium sp. LZ166]|uniref:YMGG-like glycine zipper-containing protein n=1 Tax=Aquibium pacificus TaxID=3153579 RepID=A0ABV3SHT0_9HYPH
MRKTIFAALAAISLTGTACTTAEQAGTVGAVGGALIGGAAGGTKGALIGAVAGGVGGYLIGRTADGRCQYRTRSGAIVYDRCY